MKYLTLALMVIVVALLGVTPGARKTGTAPVQDQIVQLSGDTLPVTLGDIGTKLVEAGVIDEKKMPLRDGMRGKIVITQENSHYLLNFLWAVGLANKNPILEDKTEMMNPAYGGAGGFASTGGWTLAQGGAMDHYGKHMIVPLTAAQQALVDRVSRNIYRPCCGNSTHFPDCNHGMAMLGLLEIMASQGVSEQDMYKTALIVNSYWFTDTYATIAAYMQSKGVAWDAVSPKEMLGADYSSGAGFRNIQSKVTAPAAGGGGGCAI